MAFKSNTKARSQTNYIVVHCSASAPKVGADAAMIDRWHRQKGWACIGYHFVIKRDGTVEDGREVGVIGAHASGHNSDSVGICLSGGVDDQGKSVNNYTPEQFASLKGLLQKLRQMYPKAAIQGHRDFPNVAKDCPCFDVKAWVKANGV